MDGFDNLDLKLLFELSKNGNISVPTLSKKLGINASVLYSRIKRLVRKKLIKKFTIEIDDSLLGISVKALVGINRDPKFKEQIYEKLLEISEIISIAEVSGRFDTMLQVFAKDLEDLHMVVIDKIGKIDGVQNTETFVELQKTDKELGYSNKKYEKFYLNLLSHLSSLISAVNSLGVFPSIFIPKDTHVPTISFATDFKELA